MWAVVPLKSPESAKSRLAGALNPAQRQHLLFELGKRVIDALQATRGIDAVAVVTASAEVAAFARSLGAHPILQTIESGTAAAFGAALHELAPLRLDSVLMIAGDLPLVSANAIQRVIDLSSPPVVGGELEWGHQLRQNAPSLTPANHIPVQLPADAFRASALGSGKDTLSVLAEASCLSPRRPGEGIKKSATAIIVPDRHRIGTNALLCTPPSALTPCFGNDSFRRHLAAAQSLGIHSRVLELDELALDLDCAADLDELRLRGHAAASLFDTLQNNDADLEPQTRRVAGANR